MRLVTDEPAELIRGLRQLAAAHDLVPRASDYAANGIRFAAQPVVHTSHPTFGYVIEAAGRRVVWAPEFLEFPAWAAGADLMFADAAGWARPIRFAHGTGGHAAALAVAGQARARHVGRLVFAHIGRPTIRAMGLSAGIDSASSEQTAPATRSRRPAAAKSDRQTRSGTARSGTPRSRLALAAASPP